MAELVADAPGDADGLALGGVGPSRDGHEGVPQGVEGPLPGPVGDLDGDGAVVEGDRGGGFDAADPAQALPGQL